MHIFKIGAAKSKYSNTNNYNVLIAFLGALQFLKINTYKADLVLVSGRDSARPALLELYREREETVVCSPLGIPELLGVRPGAQVLLREDVTAHLCFVTYLPALSPAVSVAHGRAFDKHLECFC